MNLKDKVIVVTGAASGIGAACARRYAERGAIVTLVDINELRGIEVAAGIGGKARFMKLDVTNSKDWEDGLAKVALLQGGIDIVHLNAGILSRPANVAHTGETLPWMTAANWDRLSAVNIDGVVYGTIAAIPHLQKRGGGQILITSSPGGLWGWDRDPFYSATKAAVNIWVTGICQLVAKDNIKVNAIMPGNPVETNMMSADWREVLPGSESVTPDHIALGFLDLIERNETGQVYLRPGQGGLVPGLRSPWEHLAG